MAVYYLQKVHIFQLVCVLCQDYICVSLIIPALLHSHKQASQYVF